MPKSKIKNKYDLTQTEIDVLSMLACGCDYFEIADTLNIGKNRDYDDLNTIFSTIRNKTESCTNYEALYKNHDILKNILD